VIEHDDAVAGVAAIMSRLATLLGKQVLIAGTDPPVVGTVGGFQLDQQRGIVLEISGHASVAVAELGSIRLALPGSPLALPPGGAS
jgi:hypothetical protein